MVDKTTLMKDFDQARNHMRQLLTEIDPKF